MTGDYDEGVEDLLALLTAAYPDPVDLFEDELAERLGVHRHPSLDCAGWRRRRVAAIEGLGSAADAAATTLEVEFLDPF